MNTHRRNRQELLTENEALKARLGETEETLRAIRSGEVDAFLVDDESSERILNLSGSESAHRMLVEAMNEGAAILNDKEMLLYCNGRLAAMLQEPLENVMGESLFRFVPSTQEEFVKRLLERAQNETCTGDIVFRRSDGTTEPVQLSLSPMQFHGLRGICAVATDLSERHRVQEELRSLSLIDELTGLCNRRGFYTLAEQELKRAHRSSGKYLLVFADLDGLKQINDNLGHLEGDQAIKDAAQVLKTTYRNSDIIARLGGDEFVALVSGDPKMDEATPGRRLQKQLDLHNGRGDRPFLLSMSIGVVMFDSRNPVPLDELLAQADKAMYEQKRFRRESLSVNQSWIDIMARSSTTGVGSG